MLELPDWRCKLTICLYQVRPELEGGELPEDSDLEVGEDDVEFVDEYAGRLGFLRGSQLQQEERYSG